MPLSRTSSHVQHYSAGELDSLLLQSGVNLQKNMQLMAAVLSDSISTVETLLDNGADANTVGGAKGSTPLIEAAAYGHVKMASLLLKHNADANARDKRGVTALAVAAANGNTEYASLLTHNGVEIDVRTDDGLTPLMFAVTNGFEDTARTLIEKRSDINAAEKSGFTPLMSAALQGHGQIATMPLELNADTFAQFGNDGSTALTLADAHGHNDIVTMIEAARVRAQALTKRREKRKARRSRRGRAATINDETPHYPSPAPRQPQAGRDEQATCVVCMDEERDVTHMCYPCGHLCACAICARHFDGGRCPTCRASVLHTMPVYRV